MDREVMRLTSLAHSLQLLKQVELQEARHLLSMRERAVDADAKEFLKRKVSLVVRDARSWSRMKVKAQRDLRLLMLERRFGKLIREVPREKWVPIYPLSGGSRG